MSTPEHDNERIIDDYVRYHRDVWRAGTTRIRHLQARRIAAALHPVTLADATEDDLLTWRDGLVGAPETVNSYISASRSLYRWMTTKSRPRIRVDDPTGILDRPKIPARPPRPMPERDFDLALACAVSQPDIYLWLGLAGCCGLRCCEIAWMTRTDVEELPDGRGLLHIEGKGGKRRTVPVGELLLLTMRPWLVAARGPVFPRPSDGKAHTADRISQLINDFLRSIGIQATAHTLRHRFGTDYHAIDPDIFRQARLMGHASVEMTRRYTEVSPVEAAQHIDVLTRRRLRAVGRVA